MRRSWLVAGPELFIGLALMGCTSASNGGDAPVDSGPGNVTCSTDRRAQIYTANMEQMGALGLLKFVLIQADPSPPIRGTNTWTVKVTDASKNTPAGTTLDVVPFMPDHGHGSSVMPIVITAADGSFSITSLYLFMPGIWRVTLTAHAGAVTDTAIFFFCIEG